MASLITKRVLFCLTCELKRRLLLRSALYTTAILLDNPPYGTGGAINYASTAAHRLRHYATDMEIKNNNGNYGSLLLAACIG